jgi:hydroxymethylbilane synthase
MDLRGLIADTAGKKIIRGDTTRNPIEAEDIGMRLARDLLDRGGKEILQEIYGND